MLYKAILMMLCATFLAGCFGSGQSVSGVVFYKQSDFSIGIPSSWLVLSQTGTAEMLPSMGKIELVANASDVKDSLKNNLVILSDNLKTFTTSADFIILNQAGAQSDYLDYIKLESKDIIFADQEKSLVYIFEAKYNSETPKIKFLQTAHVCEQKKVFLITLAIPTSIKDTSKYEQLLSSFKCL